MLICREDQIVDDEPEKGGAHYVILEDVSSFKLQYYQNNNNPLDEWDSRDKKGLPKGVSIELRLDLANKSFNFKTFSIIGLNIK